MKVDNFMLTLHQTCPLKFDLRINNNWTVRRRSAALGFGGAFHAGLAAWYRNGIVNASERLQLAFEAINEAWPAETPVDDYRTKAKCLQVMADFSKVYANESFKVLGLDQGKPMVEVTFAVDTGMYLSCYHCGPEFTSEEENPGRCPNCGNDLEPIEYGGIFDTVIEFAGQLYVLEHKSTSQLGSFYFNQFKPNNQITGYIWGAGELTGRRVSGAIINAIGVYKSSATKFERHITSRNALDIEEWKRNVLAVCEEIQWHRRTGYWPMRTGACTLYGACEFHSVHTLSSEAERQNRLQTDYIKDEWNFERRDEANTTAT